MTSIVIFAQVCYDMWKAYPQNTSLYLCAVKHCTENPMYLYTATSYQLDERKTEPMEQMDWSHVLC